MYLLIIIFAALAAGAVLFWTYKKQEYWQIYRVTLRVGMLEYKANKDTTKLEELLKKRGLKGKKLEQMVETIVYMEKINDADQVAPPEKSAFWDPRGFYKVLELAPSATMKEIKASYRRLSMFFHPDRVKILNGDARQMEEHFKVLSEAHRILCNEKMRKDYDRR